MHAADEAILARVQSHTSAVVAITGPVGSGKSTLAASLASGTPAVVISTDDYLPDYDLVPPAERDLPARAHLDQLARHIDQLRAGQPADIPAWSFQEHRRTGTRILRPQPLIIVEGIHAFEPQVAERAKTRVFVTAPEPDRWARWEHIERTGTRGMGVQRARIHFETIAEPSFNTRHDRYLALADVVVDNAGAPS